VKRSKFKKNSGWRVQLVPPARFVDAASGASTPIDDDWIITDANEDTFKIQNTRSGHFCTLGTDHVHEFLSNPARDLGDVRHAFLKLKVQLFVRASEVYIKPTPRPGEPVEGTSPLLPEALLQVSLDCHAWKNYFMNLAATRLPDGAPGEYVDMWHLMESRWLPTYSIASYDKYRPLFETGLRDIRQRFDRAAQVFAHVLSHEFQVSLSKASRQLGVESKGYSLLPSMIQHLHPQTNFQARFVGVVRVLKDLSRDADRRRAELLAGG
jgi:hypothetical protein